MSEPARLPERPLSRDTSLARTDGSWLVMVLFLFSVIALLSLPGPSLAFNDVGIVGGAAPSHTSDGPCSPVWAYFEGSVGALLMVGCGVAGIIALVLSRTRRRALVALLLLATSVATFVSRSMLSTFKPVIYLYPTIPTEVTVKLTYSGTLTATYPAYDPTLEGWRVTAQPGGRLFDSRDHREYSYLFWEGALPSDTYVMPSRGFVVRGPDSAHFLQDLLARAGLKPAEYNELIVFWYPQIKDFPYVQIALAGKEYEESARLDISPKPDSTLRVFVYFRRLNRPVPIEPQAIAPFVRRGFTVVEWGGSLLQ